MAIEREDKKMLNPLEMLVILFMVLSVLSLLGIVLLYVIKDEIKQKWTFYFLVAMGIIIAINSMMMIPTYMVGALAARGLIGALGVAALILQLTGKHENSFKIAKIMVTVSVIGGLVGMCV